MSFSPESPAPDSPKNWRSRDENDEWADTYHFFHFLSISPLLPDSLPTIES